MDLELKGWQFEQLNYFGHAEMKDAQLGCLSIRISGSLGNVISCPTQIDVKFDAWITHSRQTLYCIVEEDAQVRSKNDLLR